MNSLRVGCVKYLNALPLIHGWPGNVVLDHPSALCAQLAAGDLDVALVSSFEFLRNPIYNIVGDISISSDGPVYSVVVAHAGEMSEVEEIELDPAAQTSGNLLRCLVNERGLEARVVAPANKLCLPPATTASRAARLIIGDQAIRFRQQHAQQFQFWDLGEQWKKLTGIPFVYAIWLIRPEIAEPALVAAELRKLRDDNLTKLNAVIASQSEFEPAFCDRYYRQHLRFSLGEREIHGLRVFAELCQKYELLPEREIGLSLV